MGFPEHCTIAGLGEAGAARGEGEGHRGSAEPLSALGAAGGEEEPGPHQLLELPDPHAWKGRGRGRVGVMGAAAPT